MAVLKLQWRNPRGVCQSHRLREAPERPEHTLKVNAFKYKHSCQKQDKHTRIKSKIQNSKHTHTSQDLDGHSQLLIPNLTWGESYYYLQLLWLKIQRHITLERDEWHLTSQDPWWKKKRDNIRWQITNEARGGEMAGQFRVPGSIPRT